MDGSLATHAGAGARTHLVTSEHKQRVVVDEGCVAAPLQAARRGGPLHGIHPRKKNTSLIYLPGRVVTEVEAQLRGPAAPPAAARLRGVSVERVLQAPRHYALLPPADNLRPHREGGGSKHSVTSKNFRRRSARLLLRPITHVLRQTAQTLCAHDSNYGNTAHLRNEAVY